MKKAKILLSTALALCMGAAAVIPAFAVNAPFTYTKIGDYNADNKVNVTDVTTLQLQLSGGDVVTGAALEHTDFDGDGIFDVNDISEMQKMVVGAEYQCFMKAKDDYKNIGSEIREELIPVENKIDFELLYYKNALIFTNYHAEIKPSEYYLIKSKEEFYSIFGVYSPNFDDEYFKDNALYIELHYDAHYSNEYNVLSMGIDGNKLCLDRYYYYPLAVSPMPACWHIFYRVNKADVENVDTLSYHTDAEFGTLD